jgi:RHS repeat-associated protein
MEVVEENTGVLLVEDKINEIQTLATDNLIMQEAGFLEVYINNEAQTPVYYDNFTVAATTSNVIEINAYYPYGMIIPGLSLMAPPDKWNGYKYSAKELETALNLGVYDFGRRMYDPIAPRFWTPDRFAEKYPWLSPYSYAANNPINVMDINGDSIWYTQQDNVITMHVTGKVLNTSSDNINVKRAAGDIASGINTAFSGEFKMGEQTYTLQTDIQLKAVTSMGDVGISDHLFNIVDADGEGARGAVNEMGGKVINVASVDYANDNWFSNTFSWNNTRSGVHEFAHAVGLEHESASGWGNLLTQRGGGTRVTSGQRRTMMNAAFSINRGANSFMGRPYPYMHGFNKKTGRWETGTVHSVFNPSYYKK